MMMIVVLLISHFLPLGVSGIEKQDLSQIRYNSLLSAQCKARCLYEYRHDHSFHHRSSSSRLLENQKKQLLTINTLSLPWRSTWERCPRLPTCSSCLLPCDLDPPLLLSNENTCQAICSTVNECQRSCSFIRQLYEEEIDCQRKIDEMEIPQVFNFTAIERKSRRTVKLKWNSVGTTNVEPVFYVIEAQWKLPKSDENSTSKWGFVKEEVSHTKAIIRNIQRDQRIYFFRIAAVTRHGCSTFLTTNKPFRLSHRSTITVSPPKNFSIKDVQRTFDRINVTLKWNKPDDFVDGYEISWESINGHFSSLIQRVETSEMELMIPSLSLDKSYLFKICSLIIAASDGKKQQSSFQSISFHYENQFDVLKNVQISRPFFHNGLIKTNLSWQFSSQYRIKQFDLSWIEIECDVERFSSCYRREAVTIKNSFQLDHLRFNCFYLVTIKPIGSEMNINQSFQWTFNVTSCESIDIVGSILPPCQKDRKTVDIFSSLPPLDLLVIRNETGLNFYWQTSSWISSLVNELFYRLRIQSISDDFQIVSRDFPPMFNHFFLPFKRSFPHRFLNVTLTLMDKETIRQQQSIRIELRSEDILSSTSSSTTNRLTFWKTFFLLFLYVR